METKCAKRLTGSSAEDESQEEEFEKEMSSELNQILNTLVYRQSKYSFALKEWSTMTLNIL